MEEKLKQLNNLILIFDIDGIITNPEMRFREYRDKMLGISDDKSKTFFTNEFIKCEVGKADLKEEIRPYLENWGWGKSVDKFLDLWFSIESSIDVDAIEYIKNLRKQGIKCYAATNQEIYRTEYMRNVMELDKVFDKIFSSAEIGYMKPNFEFFDYINKNINPEDEYKILFWDDDEKNVKGAKNAGWEAFDFVSLDDIKSKLEKLWKKKYDN